jgi:transposase
MQGTNDPTRVELLDAAALCRHLVDEGSVYAFLADHRRQLFPDELFTDLFPSGRGRPSVPADQVATVMVLQALEGLSDREAAAQLRQKIAWKVACGLALTHRGFHPTVLTLWRSRLRASDRPERIFEAVRMVIAQTGILKGRHRRALGLDAAGRCGRHPGHGDTASWGHPPGASAGPGRRQGGPWRP